MFKDVFPLFSSKTVQTTYVKCKKVQTCFVLFLQYTNKNIICISKTGLWLNLTHSPLWKSHFGLMHFYLRGGGEGGGVAAIAQLHQLVLKGGEKKQLAGYSKYTLYNQHEELHTVSRNSEKFLKVADANLYISYIWKNYLKYKFENYIQYLENILGNFSECVH